MKIYVLGSSHFMHEMVACSVKLREMGYDGWIHPDYEAFVRGEHKDLLDRAFNKGEHAEVKREKNYLKVHYRHILESDVILFVNAVKNHVPNYIGGNVLMEMGQAYVNDKKIFLLYDMPVESAYLDEIKTMDPVCLHGDLANIRKYIPTPIREKATTTAQ